MRLLRCLGLFCVCLLIPAPALAGLTLIEDFETPAVDGTIWCVQEFEGELIVGGLFSGMGQERVSTLAAWNGTSWRSLGMEESYLHRVYCMTEFEGELVVGSVMPDPEGGEWYEDITELHRVFRLTPQGWEQIGEGLPAPPRALAVHDGELFVGVQFAITTGADRPLYRLVDGDWVEAGYPTGQVFASVHALESDGETLYVGGSFSPLDDLDGIHERSAPTGVYAWSDGNWAAMGSGLLSDRDVLSPSVPMGQQGVHDLEFFGGELYATGSFVSDSEGHAGFSKWDGRHWLPLPSIGVGWQLTATADGLVVTGLIAHEIDGEYRYDIAAWDGDAWSDLDVNSTASPLTTAAGSWESRLVLARDGVTHPSAYRGGLTCGPGLATWDGADWSSPIPGRAPTGAVHSLFDYQGKLVVGGTFSFTGAVGADGVAMLDGDRWVPMGDGLLGARVTSFVEFGDLLVAGGRFLAPGDDHYSGVAFWDGTKWSSRAPGTDVGSCDRTVWDLAVYQGELYVGGIFTEFCGIPASGLVRFDGGAWHGIDLDDDQRHVTALQVFEGELVVGGNFDHIDGFAARGLARFDGTTWRGIDSAAQTNVRELAVFQESLYVSRGQVSWPAQPSGLFTWDGVDSLRELREPGNEDYFESRPVFEMVPGGDELYLLARYEVPWGYESDIITWNGSSVTADGTRQLWGEGMQEWHLVAIAVSGEDLYVGGSWWMDGDPAARTLARLGRGSGVPIASVAISTQVRGDSVWIRWQVDHSPRIEGLVIEHSADGVTWTSVWESQSLVPNEGEWQHRPGPGSHRYRIAVRSVSGLVVSEEAVIESGVVVPSATRIVDATPNPFNPSTTIRFSLGESAPVSLRVYDVAGRFVRDLVNEASLGAGMHTRTWDGTDRRGARVATGTYLIVLHSPSARDTRRVSLIK